MVTTKKQEVPLMIQALKLQFYFPDSKYSIRSNTLVQKGYIQPAFLSPRYLIKVVYHRESHPNAHILVPKLLTLVKGEVRLKHVYNAEKQHLYIYYKRAKERNESQFIAGTIIPWTSERSLHCETWVATGVWHGGRIH